MIRRILTVAFWLALGAVVIGCIYWVFLGTPESSALMLAVSGGLVLVAGFVAAVVGNGGLLMALGEAPIGSVKKGTRYAHLFLVPVLLVLLGVLATRYADDWLSRYSGQISAWFIVTFGWADVTPLLRAAGYLSEWLRWVAVPLAALAAMTAVLRSGARSLKSTGWLRAAWGWRTLLVATAAYALLIDLPWRAARWRPVVVPPTWIEPALAVLRLLLVGAAMAIGAAIIVVTVARAVEAKARSTPRPA